MFIPKDNEKDLADIPDSVKKALKVIPVAHVDDVIARALSRKPEAIEWEEPPEPVAAKPAEGVALHALTTVPQAVLRGEGWGVGAPRALSRPAGGLVASEQEGG